MTKRLSPAPARALALGLALGAGLLAAPALAQDPDCENAETQAQLNVCAEWDWERMDADLNDAYQEAMQGAKDIDAELPRSQRGAAEALRAAQRLWIDYRDAVCDAESFAVRGGSMEPMVYYGCLARVSVTRAGELRTMWYY